jgi:hypothetical protein
MKRYRLGIIFLFLALSLMACNLTSMLSGNQSQQEATSEVTPAPSQDGMSNEPTEAPEDVAEPTSEAGNEPSNGSDTSSSDSAGPQSACDHPYFPLRQDATWVYYDSSDAYYYHWKVTSVTGDTENANAVMQVLITQSEELDEEQKAAAIELEYNWVCSAEEGIVSFDMATLDFSDIGDGSFSMTMGNIEGEGVMLPPADLLEPGYQWNLTFTADFTMEALMGATGKVQVNDFYTVLNKDPVEVNGETFEGLQYQRQFDIDMNMTVGGVDTTIPNMVTDFQTDTTLAKGIGFVIMDNDTQLGSVGLHLIRYNIP